MNAYFTLTSPTQSISKLVGSVLSAFIITFGLFVLMHQLTTNTNIRSEPATPNVVVDIWQNIEELPIIEKSPKLIKPEIKPLPQNIVPLIDEQPDSASLLGKYVPDVGLGPIALLAQTQLGMDDGSLRPLVRMEPKYPAEAARAGIEGWVKLMFSIDISGQVSDIEVLDAQPPRVFDREAKRALAKWKYKPPMVNGTPQPQSGMQVVLDFKLAQ